METLFYLIAGTMVGYLVGMVLLMFFEREIFKGIDKCVAFVRKLFGLNRY